MSEYFYCKEFSRMRNGKQIRFIYCKRHPEVVIDYLKSFIRPLEKQKLDLELELRCKLTEDEFNSMTNTIKFDNEFDNSYKSYEIYLYDTILREYNNDNKDVKCLLFRKEENIWNYNYYACLSAEKKVTEKKGDLISRGEVKMKRYVKEVKGWNGVIFLSQVPKIRHDLEIEFDTPDNIIMARRVLLSVLVCCRIGINKPMPIPTFEESRGKIVRNYVRLRHIKEGRRLFLFGCRSLGIWSWDPEASEINVINEDDCGNNVVFDVSLMDNGTYVVMDMASESHGWKERRLLSLRIIETWKMSAPGAKVIHRSNWRKRSAGDNWIYISPKCYSYTSFEE
ncbi:hypothetical protein EDC05_005982 [Coemansia umbellata]|uniref:Uncharacterized protein n=1 Tax=Coemansia umbellata TaxID=1424467 RepID=A0ABQ8PG17_9FUNG|nr:hypothetical protein EDC05_005982 [Coemansia umbellata]